MGQATRMLWDPRPTKTETGPSSGGHSSLRTWAETAYALPLFALALLGLVLGFRSPCRRGGSSRSPSCSSSTRRWRRCSSRARRRYRVPWDFVLALLAGAAVDLVLARRSSASR